MFRIEHLWALSKNMLRKKLLLQPTELNKAQFDNMVLETCREMAEEHGEKLVRANYKYIASLLHQEEVEGIVP